MDRLQTTIELLRFCLHARNIPGLERNYAFADIKFIFLQPVNVEGLVMYVSNREQITTKTYGLCPIRRVTL